MHQEIIISGFGGQGVLLAGKLLIHACMLEGRHVSHIPSYGIEMRGGTASCSVVISDSPIGSPLVTAPSSVIALNKPAYERYHSQVSTGGVFVYNASHVAQQPSRPNIKQVGLPCDDIALQWSSPLSANVAALGALIEATQLCSLESMRTAFEYCFGHHGNDVVERNMQVLTTAIEFARAGET